MSPLRNKTAKQFPDTAALLGAVIKKFVPADEIVRLSMEEIEDAPDVEMHELFDLDGVELRARSVNGKN
jgi:hypothetical protein